MNTHRHLADLLELLHAELQSDTALCQTRNEHIRLALRLARVEEAIQELKSIQLKDGGQLQVSASIAK